MVLNQPVRGRCLRVSIKERNGSGDFSKSEKEVVILNSRVQRYNDNIVVMVLDDKLPHPLGEIGIRLIMMSIWLVLLCLLWIEISIYVLKFCCNIGIYELRLLDSAFLFQFSSLS